MNAPRQVFPPVLYCSFCGKSHHEVPKLIAGPSTLICNECVLLCVDIIDEEGGRPTLSDAGESRIREIVREEMAVALPQAQLNAAAPPAADEHAR